jgi:uncharacterized protein YhbP (UPF0306 family)
MDSKIIAFLRQHHILSLAVCDREGPYGANCFYVFDELRQALIFASDPSSRHMRALGAGGAKAAGTIYHETKSVAQIRGVQFTGVCKEAKGREKSLYFERFGYARALSPSLWVIHLEWIKMSDNRFGFGTKLIWTRQ